MIDNHTTISEGEDNHTTISEWDNDTPATQGGKIIIPLFQSGIMIL